jgi:hypothetical protein
MVKKSLALVLAVLLFTAISSSPVFADDQSWLVGKWEMSYDPDGNAKDWLQFSADGKVTSISSSGAGPVGSYVVIGNQVQMTFTVKTRAVSMTLNMSPDRKKLLNFSKRTGNTAEYTKVRS